MVFIKRVRSKDHSLIYNSIMSDTLSLNRLWTHPNSIERNYSRVFAGMNLCMLIHVDFLSSIYYLLH